MPFTRTLPIRLHYKVDGDPSAPPLILCHLLGGDLSMWDGVVSALGDRYRIIRPDLRGHGQSAAPDGEYRLHQLEADVLGLADELSICRFALCGVSLGAFVGLGLALSTPERLTHLAISGAAAKLAPPPGGWDARGTLVREHGMGAIASMVMDRYFSPEALAAAGPAVIQFRTTLEAMQPSGYAGCCALLRDVDFRSSLPRISTPTLVVAPQANGPDSAAAASMADAITGARLVRLGSGHVIPVEAPHEFAPALASFLTGSAGDT